MSDLADLYRKHVDTLTAHAHALLDATGYYRLAIHGGRLVLKSSFDDQDWPFRPVPELDDVGTDPPGTGKEHEHERRHHQALPAPH